MGIDFNWNSNYENLPNPNLNRSSLDDTFRKVKRGVRQFMETGHDWGPYSEGDTGKHSPGRTKVLKSGDSSTRDGLSNVQDGALYLLDDSGSLKLQAYISGTWEDFGVYDHGDLEGLLSDDHPQYVNTAGDTMTGNLDMGSNFVSLPDNAEVQGNFVAQSHINNNHNNDVGSLAALQSGIITLGMFPYTEFEESGSSDAQGYSPYLPAPHFIPNLYVNNTTGDVEFMMLWDSYYYDYLNTFYSGAYIKSVLVHESGNSFDYRVKMVLE